METRIPNLKFIPFPSPVRAGNTLPNDVSDNDFIVIDLLVLLEFEIMESLMDSTFLSYMCHTFRNIWLR